MHLPHVQCKPRLPWTITLILGLGFLFLALSALANPAEAAPYTQSAVSDDTCLACHRQAILTVDLGGQALPLTIDQNQFKASVHGAEGVACVDCHTNITGFPHPKVTASSPRDFSLELYTTCRQCHAEQYEKVLDSVHQRALAAGNTNAAVCTDCHNPHTQTRLTGRESGLLTPAARLHFPKPARAATAPSMRPMSKACMAKR